MLANFDNIWYYYSRGNLQQTMHVGLPHLFTVLMPYLVKIMIHLPVFPVFHFVQKMSPLFIVLRLLG